MGQSNVQQTSTNILECNPTAITFTSDHLGLPHTHCPQTASAIQLASRLIQAESLVAFPTETVYGLGACATSATAVSKIYQTKGRPSDNPLIVHVSSLHMLQSLLPPDWSLPTVYKVLVDRFWPGPLTILVPTTSAEQSTSKIPDIVTCGLKTFAVRIPAHPIARALIASSGSPIAAPSANLSGRPSPTQAAHVKRDLEGKIELILNGGPCEVGVESTVVDGLNLDGRLRILRLGGLSVEDINQCLLDANALGTLTTTPTVEVYKSHGKDLAPEAKPTTPGMKYKHYSPKAKVIIIDLVKTHDTCDEKDIPTPAQFISDYTKEYANCSSSDKKKSIGLMLIENSKLFEQFELCERILDPVSVTLHHSSLGSLTQPEISAQRLFSAIRHLDEEVLVDIILVEALPDFGLGSTVMERLYKAAGNHTPTRLRLPA
ncbi:hypothetical protein CROQUDRAFT_664807 [Cronartium quercuum f. sp. fusiforme G11]|uniref:Threonylcarbamoyl-AMP synthase n=1 Tax=Cronartium quercuum f. sp. fusiforme G11 TaxID=708437 RepID=A0A9P6T6S2_9BASI|nr:hypothetical protein CROQUDRAFT_664807 [Cronartium quercuum f. sp. fusiforme G11]